MDSHRGTKTEGPEHLGVRPSELVLEEVIELGNIQVPDEAG